MLETNEFPEMSPVALPGAWRPPNRECRPAERFGPTVQTASRSESEHRSEPELMIVGRHDLKPAIEHSKIRGFAPDFAQLLRQRFD